MTEQKVTSINLRRLRFILIGVFAIEGFFLLYVERVRLIDNVHDLVLVSYLLHLSLALFSATILGIVWFKREVKHPFMNRISGFTAFIILIFSSVIGVIDQVTHGHITLFVVHLLAFGLLLYLKPWWNIALFSVPFVIFAGGVLMFQSNADILATHLINTTIVFIGVLFTSTTFYRYLTREIHATEQLTILATIDPLTEIPNRRYFDHQLRYEVAINKRYKQTASLVLVDIDHFKHINDTYGHDTGDIILKELAAIFQRTIRASDTLARWGGEEFMFLLSHTEPEGALVLANRLKDFVAAHAFRCKNVDLKITISIGIGRVYHEEEDYFTTSYEYVDQALYEAKRTGRNKVVLKTKEKQA